MSRQRKLRQCKKCGVLFNTRDCNACKSAYMRRRYLQDPEAFKEKSRLSRAARKPGLGAIYSARYRARHPDRFKATMARYNASHRKQLGVLRRAWADKNKDRLKDLRKKRYLKNPRLGSIYFQNRRARKRVNGGTLSVWLADKLFKLQRGKCACCGQKLGTDYHLDHRVPLVRGGKNEDSNMQLLRKKCNLEKHAKDPIDFMQSRGFLL